MDRGSKKYKQFEQCKKSALNKEDLSKKGSIDEPILNLVNLINVSEFYYTTSTCSGRITLIEKPFGEAGIKKGNCFHLNSHYSVALNDFRTVIETFNRSYTVNGGARPDDDCLWLKFEPFIMHIQCYDLDKAKQLLNIAIASGCRNSGVTFGKPDKYFLAIRSTSSMEVPVLCGNKFSIDDNYINYLCEESNRRLADNVIRLSKLQHAIKQELSRDS